MAASPIALDKDKRIRMLEDELEELRHFHQTELMLQPANMKALVSLLFVFHYQI